MVPLHLSPSITQYFIEVDAICARPILSTLESQLSFHYRLYSQWTRNLNSLTKRGRAQQFSASEIHDILDEINHRIRELKEQIDAQKS